MFFSDFTQMERIEWAADNLIMLVVVPCTFCYDRQGLTSFLRSFVLFWEGDYGQQCWLLCCTLTGSLRSLAALTFHQKFPLIWEDRFQRIIWQAATFGLQEGILRSALVTAIVWHALNMIAAIWTPETLLSTSSLNPQSISQRKLKWSCLLKAQSVIQKVSPTFKIKAKG